MSSVPSEVLRDVLLPLNRWKLDGVQFTNRRFLRLVLERMSNVCLREIKAASFRAPDKENTYGTTFIHIGGRPEQKIQNALNDAARLFSEFMHALRSSRVGFLTLSGLVFAPELAALVIQTPIVSDTLTLVAGSCAELTTTQLDRLLLHFSSTSLDINSCQFRSCQITDGLLRALSKNGVRRMKFQDLVPVDGGSFAVTNDAVVDFCAQKGLGEEEDDTSRMSGQLVLCNGRFTKDLFQRLIEASSVSTRTQPLRVIVSPCTVEDEDLCEFAQHLSYCYRDQPRQVRIYDVRGEQKGADAAMDLQIALHLDKRLELFRARRPNPDFYESDE